MPQQIWFLLIPNLLRGKVTWGYFSLRGGMDHIITTLQTMRSYEFPLNIPDIGFLMANNSMIQFTGARMHDLATICWYLYIFYIRTTVLPKGVMCNLLGRHPPTYIHNHICKVGDTLLNNHYQTAPGEQIQIRGIESLMVLLRESGLNNYVTFYQLRDHDMIWEKTNGMDAADCCCWWLYDTIVFLAYGIMYHYQLLL